MSAFKDKGTDLYNHFALIRIIIMPHRFIFTQWSTTEEIGPLVTRTTNIRIGLGTTGRVVKKNSQLPSRVSMSSEAKVFLPRHVKQHFDEEVSSP